MKTRSRMLVLIVTGGLGLTVIGFTSAAQPAVQLDEPSETPDPLVGASSSAQDAEGFQWIWWMPGPIGSDNGVDIATDRDGNVFLAGNHKGLDVDGDGTVERMADDQDGLFMRHGPREGGFGLGTDWIRTPSAPGWESASAIAPDQRGGAYVIGRFHGTLTFERGPRIAGGGGAGTMGGDDGYLARYDAKGDVAWARAFGGPGNEDAWQDIASDAEGNAYVLGRGSGAFALDDETTFRATDESTSLLASYDRDGAVRWVRVLGASAHLFGGNIQVAPDGEVVISGLLAGPMDFDEDGTPDLPAPADRDGYFARYDAEGRFLGAWSLGAGTGLVAFADDGDLFIAGALGGSVEDWYGPADFDGDGSADAEIKGAGPMSLWLARFSRDGDLRWVRSYDLDRPGGMATDGERIVVTGSFHGVRDIDEDGVPERVDRTVDPSEESDLAILVVSGEDGRPERAWVAPGPGNDHAGPVAFLPDRSTFYVTGSLQLTADFSGEGEDGEGWAKCENLGDLFLAQYRLGERQEMAAPGELKLTLEATARRVEGQRLADLTWSGPPSENVDVYRNGELIAWTANRGSYTDTIPEGVSGPFEYEVVPDDAVACTSNAVTVQF